jgi:hypothetical protein
MRFAKFPKFRSAFRAPVAKPLVTAIGHIAKFLGAARVYDDGGSAP